MRKCFHVLMIFKFLKFVIRIYSGIDQLKNIVRISNMIKPLCMYFILILSLKVSRYCEKKVMLTVKITSGKNITYHLILNCLHNFYSKLW